jgi:hypothetical protein
MIIVLITFQSIGARYFFKELVVFGKVYGYKEKRGKSRQGCKMMVIQM